MLSVTVVAVTLATVAAGEHRSRIADALHDHAGNDVVRRGASARKIECRRILRRIQIRRRRQTMISQVHNIHADQHICQRAGERTVAPSRLPQWGQSYSAQYKWAAGVTVGGVLGAGTPKIVHRVPGFQASQRVIDWTRIGYRPYRIVTR